MADLSFKKDFKRLQNTLGKTDAAMSGITNTILNQTITALRNQAAPEIKDFLIRVADKAQIALEREKVFNILKDDKFKILDEPPF